MADQQSDKQNARHSKTDDKAPALEWLAAVFGLLLVLGASGAMVYYALYENTPPRLRAEAGRIMPVGGRYRVQVIVYNEGGTTAAAVSVEGALSDGAKSIETAATTFDYVPGQSRVNGGMFFSHNPRVYRLQLEADAYMEP